jgi:hypothetical protein
MQSALRIRVSVVSMHLDQLMMVIDDWFQKVDKWVMPCHVCPGVPLRPRLCVCCATSLHRLSYHCPSRPISLLPLLILAASSYFSVMITVPLLSVLTTYFVASAFTQT